jgi:PAS domain S-box-containing protein
LRSGQEKLRTTLETIPDGIASSDPDGRISFSNGALAAILGHHDGSLGKTPFSRSSAAAKSISQSRTYSNREQVPRPVEIFSGDRTYEL